MESLYTERAHLMCPDMHFGILASIPRAYDSGRVRESLAALQDAHPFLRSLIAEEDGRMCYRKREDLAVPVSEGTDPLRDYEDFSARGWDVTGECMLRAFVYPRERDMELLLIAHHLLCDGRGLLQLTEEFARHYANGGKPAFAEERLIRSADDLPAHSTLPFISRVVVRDANRRWRKEAHRVSYPEYLRFEREYLRANPADRAVIEEVKDGAFDEMLSLCKVNGVSVNDYLIAKMMQKRNTGSVLIAADVRNRLGCYRKGAMGNYSTAFTVKVKDSRAELFSLAKQVSSAVDGILKHPQKAFLVLSCYLEMEPELIDAAAISALGGFDSASGAFVGKNMFGFASGGSYSLTNLGRIESDVLTEAMFIPPASPAAKETWGVLTVNRRMKICSSARKQAAER